MFAFGMRFSKAARSPARQTVWAYTHWPSISAPFGNRRPSGRSVAVRGIPAVGFERNCRRRGSPMMENLYRREYTLVSGLLSGRRIGGI